MTKGHVIFLNGTSSSGKTTIARSLMEKLKEPYMYISVDGFFHLYPERILSPANEEELEAFKKLIPAVISGMQRSVAVLAEAGNNVIVDHVLERSEWLKECIELFKGLDILFVGVKCPLNILEKRETDRGDRAAGLARYQYDRVHAHGLYDVEVDTSVLNVDECVGKIIDALSRKTEPGAFSQLNSDL